MEIIPCKNLFLRGNTQCSQNLTCKLQRCSTVGSNNPAIPYCRLPEIQALPRIRIPSSLLQVLQIITRMPNRIQNTKCPKKCGSITDAAHNNSVPHRSLHQRHNLPGRLTPPGQTPDENQSRKILRSRLNITVRHNSKPSHRPDRTQFQRYRLHTKSILTQSQKQRRNIGSLPVSKIVQNANQHNLFHRTASIAQAGRNPGSNKKTSRIIHICQRRCYKRYPPPPSRVSLLSSRRKNKKSLLQKHTLKKYILILPDSMTNLPQQQKKYAGQKIWSE